MKRANQLQPLSREHHLGLVLSRHAKECANDVNEIAKHWTALTDYINQNMTNHFKVEDDLILAKLEPYKDSNPEVAKAIATIEEQHSRLYQSLDSQTLSATQVQELGNALYDHIRYEERVLFPLAEKVLSEHELNSIYGASSKNVKREEENR